jgi:hypothetical protein
MHTFPVPMQQTTPEKWFQGKCYTCFSTLASTQALSVWKCMPMPSSLHLCLEQPRFFFQPKQAQDTTGDEHNAISGALREAVAHQRTQLQEAKAIIKQQGKELRDKDGEFEALKERLTGVDHPGALLAPALIPADELHELMDKIDGKDPAMVGARRGAQASKGEPHL